MCNDYYPPDSYYDLDIPDIQECYKCDEKFNKIEDAKGFLSRIVKRLYTKDHLNVYELENDLDELCNCLGMRIHEGEIQIQRKTNDWISDWVEANKLYNEKIASIKK